MDTGRAVDPGPMTGVTVSLGDRLRAWLRGDDDPSPTSRKVSAAGGDARRRTRHATRSGRSRAEHPSTTFDSAELTEFARTRRGIEVYLEPRTQLYGDSVLIVADDGEYLRRPVPDASTVRRWCDEHGLPVYDAARTGYPRRVRDYDRGVRPDRIELTDLPPWPGDEPLPPPPPEED